MKTLMEKPERLLELGGTKKDIALLAIGGIALVCSLLKWQPLPFDLAWIAVVLCGVPIVLEAIIGLVTAFDIKADVLVSLALIASVCIGEIFAAGEVAFIMQLGGLLEELTVAKARAGIEKIVHLTPQTARVLAPNGTETVVPAEQVQVGDTLRVLPGESVPVDGVICTGRRYAARPAGRERAGRRCDLLRPDVDQSGGHDRRVAAGEQRPRRRGLERHGQSVRRV